VPLRLLLPLLLGSAPGCGQRGVPHPAKTQPICPTETLAAVTDVCPSEPLSLEVATGVAGPVLLHDGDPVVMTYGPQGGWHIWTAGVIHGFVSLDDTPGASASRPMEVDVDVVRTATGTLLTGTASDAAIDLSNPAFGNWSDATCSGAFYGHQSRIVDASSGVVPKDGETYRDLICELEGEDLTLTVAVTDLVDGATTTDTVHVLAQLDPVDVAYCH
jgi:hypothetical protein